ncbi:type IV secretion system protein VirB10 [Shewanella sp. 202IG2-18]|uniref:type IV secretion system protein VirB10 n=1 Tax=Parashewanella hymeniacidonis TaxID=2807618 RepID=UPI001961E742|nr:type IV secretion system protein VirB10 [Parashewanella hymeniacidonis]MBM7073966.1 type IV secretion system protein VirB10 [Parashewanella hymeniacidonis]
MTNTHSNRTESPPVETQAVPELTAHQGSGFQLSKPIMILTCLVVILLLVLVNGGFSHSKAQQDPANNKEIGNHLGNPPALPKPSPNRDKPNDKPDKNNAGLLHTGLADLATSPSNPQYLSVNQGKQWTPAQRKQFDDLLVVNRNSQLSRQTTSVSQSSDNYTGESRPNALATQLQATKVKGSVASRIVDTNLFITKGAFLDCILETAISSDVPGMTRCQLSRDIYSTNGKVLLLEKGSHIVGQYQSGLLQGVARIFVLWDRIETPNGVIIDLDSPGTDTLGRSGHTGFVDGHFKQRFGSAILLSLIGDAGNYAANKANSGDKNQIQFGNTIGGTKDLASIALQDSIRIKPTLLKNQGEHINVFVARDLDFRSVYDLQFSRE